MEPTLTVGSPSTSRNGPVRRTRPLGNGVHGTEPVRDDVPDAERDPQGRGAGMTILEWVGAYYVPGAHITDHSWQFAPHNRSRGCISRGGLAGPLATAARGLYRNHSALDRSSLGGGQAALASPAQAHAVGGAAPGRCVRSPPPLQRLAITPALSQTDAGGSGAPGCCGLANRRGLPVGEASWRGRDPANAERPAGDPGTPFDEPTPPVGSGNAAGSPGWRGQKYSSRRTSESVPYGPGRGARSHGRARLY